MPIGREQYQLQTESNRHAEEQNKAQRGDTSRIHCDVSLFLFVALTLPLLHIMVQFLQVHVKSPSVYMQRSPDSCVLGLSLP